jgi:hypothetical protein
MIRPRGAAYSLPVTNDINAHNSKQVQMTSVSSEYNLGRSMAKKMFG